MIEQITHWLWSIMIVMYLNKALLCRFRRDVWTQTLILISHNNTNYHSIKGCGVCARDKTLRQTFLQEFMDQIAMKLPTGRS